MSLDAIAFQSAQVTNILRIEKSHPASALMSTQTKKAVIYIFAFLPGLAKANTALSPHGPDLDRIPLNAKQASPLGPS
jgi:hypothetical protein